MHQAILTCSLTDTASVGTILPPVASSVRQARALTRSELASRGLTDHEGTAELLVSELVTNALRYAACAVRLSLSFRGDTLHCEVEDTSLGPSVVRGAREEDESGRGLLLVQELARAWGRRDSRVGKVVWFELGL
ncbi:ATP-binding protein [Streptomyces halobius]|uniref:ATP-binding protein n=1 Tax=Streptomyces halobius TaxID=2879846 RepID=A0ABY4M2U9_9ACTN|nr:ATP-binding protein [Streptomyces halobius]UQA92094.1 ATP-binding protein [Streptomyces halobius]